MSKVIGCVLCERDIEREHDIDCPNHPDNQERVPAKEPFFREKWQQKKKMEFTDD